MSTQSEKAHFQKGRTLCFPCTQCQSIVSFSIFELENTDGEVKCSQCNQCYQFSDPNLRRQLKKFEALCRTIKDSEEILGSTAVGVDVGQQKVKIPFKLLLTRFNSCIELNLEGQKLTISFRLEPCQHIENQ